METATLPVRLYEYSGMRKFVYQLRLSHLFPSRLRDLEAMLPHLPQRPLRQVLPENTEAYGQSHYRVGFFLGCAQNLLYAEESQATVRVLARNGCTVITRRDVQCCGMPARGYGRLDLVRKQAIHNIEIFEKTGVDLIITDCATCGSTLKDYEALLQHESEWASRAKTFSSRVRDVSEFLADLPLKKPEGRISSRVTYHDPCHLRRGQQVWQQPRYILGMIDGLEYVELPEADWCCGSAGSQLITHYDTSVKVMERKLKNLSSTQAQVIASGCPGCQMQLNTAIKRHDLDIRVVHPITLLDDAYQVQNA
jgi:glycolate oxidase iron-sulfur subunit